MTVALIGYLVVGVAAVVLVAQVEYRQEQARLRSIAEYRAQRFLEGR